MITQDQFKSEVEAAAKEIEVEPKEIVLRPLKTKWASCSQSGRLTSDSGLLKQPKELRRKMIVHELLHLSVPNHGKLFKTLHSGYSKLRNQGGQE